MNPLRLQYLVRIALIAAVYYAAGVLGMAFSTVDQTVSPIWFPSGVAFAVLFLGGPGLWPGIFLGKLILFLVHGFHPGASIIAGAGAALEALLAVGLVRRFTLFRGYFRTMPDLFGYYFWAALVAPLLGTAAGLMSLFVFDRLPPGNVTAAGLTWWLGDAMGMITAAPILLSWLQPMESRLVWNKKRRGEALALALSLALCLYITFIQGVPGLGSHLPVFFIVFPFQIWAAFRFHTRGATITLFAISVVALGSTYADLGPLGLYTSEQRYWLLNLYLTVLAINAQVILVSYRQRMEAMETLRQSQERFRRIVETSADWVWETDPDQVFTYCSQRVYNLIGYTPEEVQGHSPFHFMVAEDAERLQAALQSWRDTREPFRLIENVYLHKDGHKVFAEVSGVPILDETGHFRGYRGISRDVTSRRNAERALRESEERFQTLMSNCPLVVTIKNEAGRILYVNAAFERAYGLKMNDCLGKDVFDLYPASLAEEVRANDRAVLLSQAPFQVEEVEPRPEGNRYWMCYKFPLPTPVGTPLLASMSVDITEQKRAAEDQNRLEAQLQQSQKMEAIGTLAGGIAHDFNNLLGVIIGYASAAQVAMQDRPEATADIREALAAANQGKELVRQILTFSRKEVPHREPVLLNSIVEDGLKMLRVALPAGVTVDTRLEADCPPVEADRTQLQQVIMNLATNAIHAMSRTGGRLEFSLQTIRIDVRKARLLPELKVGPHVLLTVKDNGHGMPPGVMERIFDPFFTTKAAGSGTGLGLSVVQGIIKSHRGAIRVDSIPSLGTTFRIYFPTTALPLPPPPPPPSATYSAGHGHILVVEDETRLAALNKRILEKQGHRVTVFHDSTLAWEAFQAAPASFSLVITDQNLPVMTGLELAEKIHDLNPAVPVILSSGCSDPAEFGSLEETGVSAFLAKPYTPDGLIAFVARWLAEKVV